MIMASVVPNKGLREYAVEVFRRFVGQLGYKKAILKSDNEPAILSLKEAVRRETSLEIVMEESFVGDHQANGIAENAVREARGVREGPAEGVLGGRGEGHGRSKVA